MGQGGRKGRSVHAGTAQGAMFVVAAFLPIMAVVSLAPAVPMLLRHFRESPGASTLVPLLVSAPGLMIALLAPTAGWLTDRYGRRPLLVTSILLYGVFGCLPFFLNDLISIFISRLILGASCAAIMTGINTLLGDYFDEEKRRLWLTIQGIMGPVLGMIVVYVAGALTDRVWNGAFLVFTLALPIFLAGHFFLFEPPAAPVVDRATGSTPFEWRRAAWLCLVTFCSANIFFSYVVEGGIGVSLLGADDPSSIGRFMALTSLGIPVGAVIFGRGVSRLRVPGMVAILLALLGAGMLGMGLSRNLTSLATFAVVQQIGGGVAVPSLLFWAANSVAVEHRGRVMGLWAASYSMGQFTSPLLVTAARVGEGNVLGSFQILGVLTLVGSAIAITISVRSDNVPVGANVDQEARFDGMRGILPLPRRDGAGPNQSFRSANRSNGVVEAERRIRIDNQKPDA